MNYTTKSPILFLIFNRPDITKEVFRKIRETQPSRLYIAADGPRIGRNENAICEETRNIIKEVDWKCEVKTLLREENLGCKNAVSSAITWFFKNEEEGIILEDDCLPANDFFRYCDELLEKYRNVSTIWHIGGSNRYFGKTFGNESYFFSNCSHVWGWASWSRAWSNYDVNLSKYNNIDVKEIFLRIFGDEQIAERWEHIFDELKQGKIDTWDYQWSLAVFFNNALSIIPNVNLIKNIGFGEGATHTQDANNISANIITGDLNNITHPAVIIPHKEADIILLRREFGINTDTSRSKDSWYKKLKKRIRGKKI